jgi:hypothetical protein
MVETIHEEEPKGKKLLGDTGQGEQVLLSER